MFNTEHSALAEEIPNEGSDENSESLQIQEPEEAQMAKRAWKQLQGSWGKRNIDGISDEQLQRLIQNYMNQDYVESLRSLDYQQPRFQGFNLIPDADDFDIPPPLEKRAWRSMNKQNSGSRNGWKKREPGNWNNLRGLWGKRSQGMEK